MTWKRWGWDPEVQAELDRTFRTEVMHYRNDRDFLKDSEIRHSYGWRISDQGIEATRAKVGSKAVGAGAVGATAAVATAGCLPLGCLVGAATLLIPWRTKPKITVVWVKDPVTGHSASALARRAR